MPARFRKKVRRMRGSHTHGWGAKKKHRGAGSQAGRGGSNKFYSRKTSAILEKQFGKKGFVSLSKTEVKTINVHELDELVHSRNVKEIDVSVLGYDKVLGSGKITVPLIVKANSFSAGAKNKIEGAGGKAVAPQEIAAKKLVKQSDEIAAKKAASSNVKAE